MAKIDVADVRNSGTKPYTVTINYKDPSKPGLAPSILDVLMEWQCSCLGWTRHVPRRDCKHITLLKQYVLECYEAYRNHEIWPHQPLGVLFDQHFLLTLLQEDVRKYAPPQPEEEEVRPPEPEKPSTTRVKGGRFRGTWKN